MVLGAFHVNPPLKAIKIWAHLTGVPLDMRHTKGLSLVKGVIGDPKETDEFTRNMVSLTVSHVKVEGDLTQPLPHVVEFERESGEVAEVFVHYPWVPPTCSHYHELGHIMKNCLSYSPPPPSSPVPVTETEKASSSKPKVNLTTNDPSQKTQLNPSSFTPAKASKQKQKIHRPISFTPSKDPAPSSSKTPPPLIPANNSKPKSTSNPFESPDPLPRPSLKRSRSSPTLSPPLTSHHNPFLVLQNLDNNPSDSPHLLHPYHLNSNTKSFSFGSRGSPLSEDLSYPPVSVKLFWNVCGLNNPDKHKPFVNWLNSQRSLFGALIETHIKEPKFKPYHH